MTHLNSWQKTSQTLSLDATAHAARMARDVLRGTCDEALVAPPITETALLLVSEVVTNAIVHGDGRPVLSIEVQPAVMRVTVTDDGAGTPQVRRDPSLLGDAGRGLLLVETLAARWGTNRRLPTGKSVWFELDHG